MNTRALLDELRNLDVKVTADGDRLCVDAPAGSITDQTRATLTVNKSRLLNLLEWEQRKLREASERGLVIRWAKEPGWIAMHDPLTGEWHELKASECLPGVVKAANAHRQKKNGGTRQ